MVACVSEYFLRECEDLRKTDEVVNLERRQQSLEEEIADALRHWAPDDPMVADLKSRMLHLKGELERLRNISRFR